MLEAVKEKDGFSAIGRGLAYRAGSPRSAPQGHIKLGMVVHACNFSIQGIKVQSYPLLLTKF